VRDTENIITTFKISQSVTATAIMGEENLHPRTAFRTRKMCRLRKSC